MVPIKEAIDCYRHVPGLCGARVEVAIVLREEVHVVEDETLEVVLLERLRRAHVQQHGAVEGSVAPLLHDEDAVVHQLFLEEGVNVEEECPQVLFPVPVGDNDGHAVSGGAVGRLVAPAQIQVGEPERKKCYVNCYRSCLINTNF